MECVYSLGPFCWHTALKFYIWLAGIIMIWTMVGVNWYVSYKNNQRIKELRARIRAREGKDSI